MVRWVVILITLLLNTVTTTWVVAATAREYNVKLYNSWVQVPTDTLLQCGQRYMHNVDSRDSALVCYSIVANRYYEGKLTTTERNASITAMVNIGYLYLYSYYDYQQAYTWLNKAYMLADKHHNSKLKAYTLLNMGNLMALIKDLNGVATQQHSAQYFRRA